MLLHRAMSRAYAMGILSAKTSWSHPGTGSCFQTLPPTSQLTSQQIIRLVSWQKPPDTEVLLIPIDFAAVSQEALHNLFQGVPCFWLETLWKPFLLFDPLKEAQTVPKCRLLPQEHFLQKVVSCKFHVLAICKGKAHSLYIPCLDMLSSYTKSQPAVDSQI